MCEYFSCILRPGGKVNWCERDSHEDTIQRLHLKDNQDGYARKFLRIEVTDGRMVNCYIDENDMELPDWYTEHEGEYHDAIDSILKKLNPLHKQWDGLWDQYQKELEKSGVAHRKASRLLKKEITKKEKEFGYDYEMAERWQAVEEAKLDVIEAEADLKTREKYAAKEKAVMDKIASIPGYVPLKTAKKGG